MKNPIKVISTKRTTMGIILIILAIVLMFAWEFFGRERLVYDKVLVLNSDVSKGTLITGEMLSTKYVDVDGRELLRESDAESIVGKEAAQLVKGDEVLYSNYFVDAGISPDSGKDTFVLSIPKEWIYTYPQTIRRGDTIYFYNDGDFVTSAKVAYAKNSSNQEVKSQDDERLESSSAVSQLEVVVTKEQATKLSQSVSGNGKLIIMYN